MASRAVREDVARLMGSVARALFIGVKWPPGIRPADLLFLDLLDFREEVPECGDTTSASAS
jgi:hypothetical protein